MPFYRDRVYPHIVNLLGDPQPIQAVRRKIIPLAQGDVLEIEQVPARISCTMILAKCARSTRSNPTRR